MRRKQLHPFRQHIGDIGECSNRRSCACHEFEAAALWISGFTYVLLNEFREIAVVMLNGREQLIERRNSMLVSWGMHLIVTEVFFNRINKIRVITHKWQKTKWLQNILIIRFLEIT